MNHKGLAIRENLSEKNFRYFFLAFLKHILEFHRTSFVNSNCKVVGHAIVILN